MTYETQKPNKNHSQVLMSRKTSRTWSHLHAWDSRPCWLARTRSIATNFSFSVRNRAPAMVSGMKKKVIKANTKVKQAKKRKTIYTDVVRDC